MPAAMNPKPPLVVTAAANSGVEAPYIGADTIGVLRSEYSLKLAHIQNIIGVKRRTQQFGEIGVDRLHTGKITDRDRAEHG